jgi:hypothetical protein
MLTSLYMALVGLHLACLLFLWMAKTSLTWNYVAFVLLCMTHFTSCTVFNVRLCSALRMPHSVSFPPFGHHDHLGTDTALRSCSIFQGPHPEVELMHHLVSLCLISEERRAVLPSSSTAHVPNSAQVEAFHTCFLVLFSHNNRPKGRVMVSMWFSFAFHWWLLTLSVFWVAHWLFVALLWRKVCSSMWTAFQLGLWLLLSGRSSSYILDCTLNFNIFPHSVAAFHSVACAL